MKGRPRGVTKQENTDRVHEGPGFACGERCALRAGLPVSQDLDRRAIILFRQLSYQLHRERLGVSFSLDWKGHWKCLGFSLLLGVSCLSDKFRDSRKGSSGTDLCVDGDEVRDGLTWGRVASTNKVKSAEAHSTLLL